MPANEVTADEKMNESLKKASEGCLRLNRLIQISPREVLRLIEDSRRLREVEAQRDMLADNHPFGALYHACRKAQESLALAEQEKAKLVGALERMMKEFGEDCEDDCDSECCPFYQARAALTPTQPPQGEQKPKGGA